MEHGFTHSLLYLVSVDIVDDSALPCDPTANLAAFRPTPTNLVCINPNFQQTALGSFSLFLSTDLVLSVPLPNLLRGVRFRVECCRQLDTFTEHIFIPWCKFPIVRSQNNRTPEEASLVPR
jgi:hypothetical protein